jgi:hypothetical protein
VWVGNARARRNHGFYVENCFVVWVRLLRGVDHYGGTFLSSYYF